MPPPHQPTPEPGAALPATSLNESQRRAVLFGFLDLHRRMAEMEAQIAPSGDPSPFSRHINDLSPAEAETVRGAFARLRSRMLAWLQEAGVPVDMRRVSLRWALRAGMNFLHVGVAEMGPAQLRGYGPVDETAAAAVVRLQRDLNRLLDDAGASLRQDHGGNLPRGPTRPAGPAPADVAATRDAGPPARLRVVADLVRGFGLTSLLPTLRACEALSGDDPPLEVAVLGQFKSGKSSLLNAVLGGGRVSGRGAAADGRHHAGGGRPGAGRPGDLPGRFGRGSRSGPDRGIRDRGQQPEQPPASRRWWTCTLRR